MKILTILLFHVLQIPSQVMPVMNLVQSVYGQQPSFKVTQAFAKSVFSPGGTLHTLLYYNTERYRTVL
jgi:hypothetical protein